MIRRAKKTGETMIIFSVNGIFESDNIHILGSKENILTEMVQQMTEKYKNITSVYMFENTSRADVLQ